MPDIAVQKNEALTVWVVDLRESIASFFDEKGHVTIGGDRDLSELDRKDIERLVRPRDKAALAARRLARNKILHGHIPGSHTTIVRGPNGKPRWEEGLAFNGSQSASFFAFAVSHSGAVGIDIEQASLCAPLPELEKKYANRQHVIARFFSPEERDWLAGFEPEGLARWHKEFLRMWTRKEAAVKCWGKSIESHCYDVRSLNDDFAWNGETWHLRTLPLPDSFMKTVDGDQYGWLSICAPDREYLGETVFHFNPEIPV